MVAEFIRQHPPSSPVLAGYGHALPAWIASFSPLAEWPWLADLTRLELLFIDALHAAETTSLVSEEQLVRLAQTGLVSLTAGLVPSVRLFSSPYAIYSLWAAHQEEEPLFVDPLQPEQVLLFRLGMTCGLRFSALPTFRLWWRYMPAITWRRQRCRPESMTAVLNLALCCCACTRTGYSGGWPAQRRNDMALMRSFLQRGQALLQDSLIPFWLVQAWPPHSGCQGKVR